MTNSFNKMAGKNSAERNGTPGRPRSTSKLRPVMKQSNVTPPRSKSISIPNAERLTLTPSPQAVSTPPPPPSIFSKSFGSSPSRTSPGLMAGHFAGGKWTEPPSPASLPKPPQHWTQLIFSSKFNGKPQQQDIASQLKVLLNVQA